jgi:hypothetical protein
MKQYTIALNASPEEKWQTIIRDFKPEILDIYQKLDQTYSKFISGFFSQAIGLSSYLGCVLHDKEINYIAKACGIPFGKLVLLQIMYELSACCTSAVFPLDGELIHFRTMDWPLMELKKLTIQINFQKENKTQYSVITWAGYIGALTAMKPGLCSISLNYRQTTGSLFQNVKNLTKGYWPAGYLIRHVMEHNMNYAQILDHLTQSNLVAPCYIIVCGLESDQCVNIVRDRESFKVYKMHQDKIVQTNIDPEEFKTLDILYSVERNRIATKLIDELKEKKKKSDDLFKTFDVKPIINSESIYVCVMKPKTGSLQVRIC